MMETKLVRKAREFATKAHEGQFRKWENAEFITHPTRVANKLYQYGHRDEVIAAGFLHDVLEDTPVSSPRLRAEFGTDVTSLVEQVTNISLPFDGNRAARKAMERWHLAHASSNARSIKLADIIDNGKGMITAMNLKVYGALKFGPLWFQEKQLLLPLLRLGNRDLFDQATEIVRSGLLVAPQIASPSPDAQPRRSPGEPLLGLGLIGGL